MEEKIKSHLKKDMVMATIVDSVALPDIDAHGDVYLGLVRSIVFQQLSGKAAQTIYGRFLQLFEDGYPHADQLINLNMEALRAVGLSRQKASYIQNVADFFLNQHQPPVSWEDWDDEKILKHLTQIKGVGTWTVQMILMFTLGRPDVLPLGDLGIQQAMSKAYHIEGPPKVLKAQMEKIATNWQPYRSFASRLLWKWLDS